MWPRCCLLLSMLLSPTPFPLTSLSCEKKKAVSSVGQRLRNTPLGDSAKTPCMLVGLSSCHHPQNKRFWRPPLSLTPLARPSSYSYSLNVFHLYLVFSLRLKPAHKLWLKRDEKHHFEQSKTTNNWRAIEERDGGRGVPPC